MRTHHIAVVAAMLAIGVPGGFGIAHAQSKAKAPAKAPAPAKKKVRACVNLSQENDPERRTITFRIDNDCQQEMACKLRWELTCLHTEGGSATVVQHEVEGSLATGTASTWEASAATCGPGDGYQISAPRWTCKLPSTDVAATK